MEQNGSPSVPQIIAPYCNTYLAAIPYTLAHILLYTLDHPFLTLWIIPFWVIPFFTLWIMPFFTLWVTYAIIYTLDQSHCRVTSLTGTLQDTSHSARLTSHFRVICHGHGEGQLSGRVLHTVLAAAWLLLQSPHPFGAAETSAGGAWTLRPRPLAVLVRDASQDASQHGPHPVHLSNTESDKSVRRTTWTLDILWKSLVASSHSFTGTEKLPDLSFRYNQIMEGSAVMTS